MYFVIFLSNLISISDGVRVAYQLDKFSTPNGVIEIHNSKKDIQYNGKKWNNDLLNETRKLKIEQCERH